MKKDEIHIKMSPELHNEIKILAYQYAVSQTHVIKRAVEHLIKMDEEQLVDILDEDEDSKQPPPVDALLDSICNDYDADEYRPVDLNIPQKIWEHPLDKWS